VLTLSITSYVMVTMSDYKLKIKIGDHEFEAEGPADVVQDQFAAFRELITNVPATKQKESPEPKTPADANAGTSTNGSVTLALDKIMRADGRLVSLTVRAASISDAVLVLLLGQRQFRSNDAVTGAEIIDGMRESGQVVARVDHTLNRLSEEGTVITIGANRGRRYRLTNAGLARAQEIARTMIALVP